ncbi:hypothetical protein A9P44_08435 [Paenibacillus polymyxa]|nr:hypothetical protein [Paenibacillus polymyxa]OBA00981.1 hypothetical protein A9P44_08435 [Paenibacillus polymyxa]
MRRIFVSLLVSSCLLISGLLPTALSYAENSTSNLPVVVEDAAVRIEYSVELRPGPNPLEITTNDKGSAKIMVRRKVLKPSSVPIRYNHASNAQDIRFTKPTQGYLRVQAGDPIAIAGVVTDTYLESNEVSFGVAAFQNDDFIEVEKKTVIPLKQDKSFNGSVVIQKPGAYLINILSPDVLVGGSSPYGSVKWAEIAVEELPKITKKP